MHAMGDETFNEEFSIKCQKVLHLSIAPYDRNFVHVSLSRKR